MSAGHSLHAQISAALASAGDVEGDTLGRLVPLVYDQLRAMAHRQLGDEYGARTVQTTALVHEAYLRVAGDERVTRRGRHYFFAAASRAMRQVLIENARRRNAVKRGGGVQVISLDEDAPASSAFIADVLDLDKALDQLALRNDRHARVVECRFFGGLNVEETAAALDVSPRTVKSDWAMARAWLYEALRGPSTP
jgi:RNA polymerase sigma-70 factor, ECF subfamily